MHSAFPDTWLYLAIAFGVVKVLVTVPQVLWPKGALDLTRSTLGRWLYIAGKVSPLGLVGSLLIRALHSGSHDAVWLGWGLAAVCLMVGLIVSLRISGRWYGVAHMLRSKRQRDHR